MIKPLKILGIAAMLLIFVVFGVFFGSLTIDSSFFAKVFSTSMPAFFMGLLIGLSMPKLWLFSGFASVGYILGGIGGYPTIGGNTLTDKIVFLISVPIVFAFLGGYVGRQLRRGSY